MPRAGFTTWCGQACVELLRDGSNQLLGSDQKSEDVHVNRSSKMVDSEPMVDISRTLQNPQSGKEAL
jgi:hypothetical protein